MEANANPFGNPPPEVQVKFCCDNADAFVKSFYQDINNGNSISSYYIDSSTLYAAVNESADIVINGAKLSSSAEYEALLLEQRGGPSDDNSTSNGHHRGRDARDKSRVRYDLNSYDAQPVNMNFQIALPEHLSKNETAHNGGCISMLISVMGTLHIDNGDDDPAGPLRKTFTDVLVLWPNWMAKGRGAVARREKNKFLIASQNYRTL